MQTFSMIIAMLLLGGISAWCFVGACFVLWLNAEGFGGYGERVLALVQFAAGILFGWLAMQVAPFTINVT